jgi:lipopolysaccharide export system permease protein
MLSILHRYVLRELLRSFALSLAALSAIMLLGGIYKPLKHGVGLADLIGLLPYMLPYLFAWVIPAALLAACVMTFGRLSAENELTATSASGIPLRYMCYPAFLMALVLTAGAIPLNDWLIPNCRLRKEGALRRVFLQQPFRVSMIDGLVTTKIGGYKIYVESVDGDTLHNVVVIEPREAPENPGEGGAAKGPAKPRKGEAPADAESAEINVYRARRADYSIDDEAGEIRIVLHEAKFTIVAPGRAVRWLELIAGQQMLSIPVGDTEVNLERRDNRTTTELLRRAEKARGEAETAPTEKRREDARRDLTRTLTEVHLREALSFSILALSLIGVPLGIWMRRESRLASFAVAVVVFPLHYYMIAGGERLAREQMVAPRIALWAPDALTAAIGMAMLLRTFRR